MLRRGPFIPAVTIQCGGTGSAASEKGEPIAMISNTFIIRPCAAATCVRSFLDRRNMCDSACALRERPRARCAMCEDRRRCAGFRALPCYLLLPIVPPGSRAAVRRLSPQVRGGRCRSSAARAKCRMHNGFYRPTVRAARKRNSDALRRVVLTPQQAFSRLPAP